jgi:hypothetical protein
MRRFFVVFAACAIGAFAVTGPVLAHGEREQRDLGFVVGWANEPAFVGQPNAVQLRLEHGGEPAEGAENTLKVTVSVGDESTDPLALRTVFDAPGEYRADMIPTVVGGYTFHFTGTVDGEKVDQSFTSPKDGFDEVTSTSEISFPKQAPSTTELAEKLVSAERDVADAKDSVGTARMLAIGGLALGVAAIALALVFRRSPA